MAITIPNNNIGCLQARGSSEGGVDFHKHCQATVLSANGTSSGNGATWNVISDLSLSNLPSNWLDYFKNNKDNITQDLRGILELLNVVAGEGQSFTISFKDIENKFLTSATFSKVSANPTVNLGRYIQLNIAGQQLKFHTAKTDVNGCPDQLSVLLSTLKLKNGSTTQTVNTLLQAGGTASLDLTPQKNNIQIQYNGTSQGTVTGVYGLSSAQTVNIEQDYCHLPCESKSQAESLILNRNNHVYKVQVSKNYAPQFSLAKYSSIISDDDIITWELHVKNLIKLNVNITINNLTLTNYGSTPYSLVNLTDQLYVTSGKTNVYVFRYDCGWNKLTYSLAYIC